MLKKNTSETKLKELEAFGISIMKIPTQIELQIRRHEAAHLKSKAREMRVAKEIADAEARAEKRSRSWFRKYFQRSSTEAIKEITPVIDKPEENTEAMQEISQLIFEMKGRPIVWSGGEFGNLHHELFATGVKTQDPEEGNENLVLLYLPTGEKAVLAPKVGADPIATENNRQEFERIFNPAAQHPHKIRSRAEVLNIVQYNEPFVDEILRTDEGTLRFSAQIYASRDVNPEKFQRIVTYTERSIKESRMNSSEQLPRSRTRVH